MASSGGANFLKARARGLQKLWTRMAISQDAAQHMFMKLGFRTEAVLSDFVKKENGLTEDLAIMSQDFGASVFLNASAFFGSVLFDPGRLCLERVAIFGVPSPIGRRTG